MDIEDSIKLKTPHVESALEPLHKGLKRALFSVKKSASLIMSDDSGSAEMRGF